MKKKELTNGVYIFTSIMTGHCFLYRLNKDGVMMRCYSDIRIITYNKENNGKLYKLICILHKQFNLSENEVKKILDTIL